MISRRSFTFGAFTTALLSACAENPSNLIKLQNLASETTEVTKRDIEKFYSLYEMLDTADQACAYNSLQLMALRITALQDDVLYVNSKETLAKGMDNCREFWGWASNNTLEAFNNRDAKVADPALKKSTTRMSDFLGELSDNILTRIKHNTAHKAANAR